MNRVLRCPNPQCQSVVIKEKSDDQDTYVSCPFCNNSNKRKRFDMLFEHKNKEVARKLRTFINSPDSEDISIETVQEANYLSDITDIISNTSEPTEDKILQRATEIGIDRRDAKASIIKGKINNRLYESFDGRLIKNDRD
jgi:hypothetical protein